MTVSELIEELRKYAPETPCVRSCGGGVFIEFKPSFVGNRKVFDFADRIWGIEFANDNTIKKMYDAIEIC